MSRLFGKILAEQLLEEKQHYIDNIHNRDVRVNNGETDYDDCFMSERVEHQGISKCDMMLDILKGDGLANFEVVVDKEGKEVRVNYFMNKWNNLSVVGRGVFASSIKALCKKTGWTVETRKLPIWVKFESGVGGGMLSAYTGSYKTCRWHTNMVTGEYFGFPD